ncbi:MAG: hypothetical protein KGI58_02770 [Patescibacteria group bacterium]|nr:hypothetical protein [Patescibacteria group bacterium]
MKNDSLQWKIFRRSKRGKIISLIEMGTIMCLFSLVMVYLFYKFERSPYFTVHELKIFLVGFGIFGLFFGMLVGSTGSSFFSYKLFPPTKHEIEIYKKSIEKEFENEKSGYQNAIMKIEKELTELKALN